MNTAQTFLQFIYDMFIPLPAQVDELHVEDVRHAPSAVYRDAEPLLKAAPIITHRRTTPVLPGNLLREFIAAEQQVEAYKNGGTIVLDGQNLTIAAVAAAARFHARVALSDSPDLRESVAKSRRVIEEKVQQGKSVYGVSTGFGGSADTRTDNTLALGDALFQMQHIGVLPSSPDSGVYGTDSTAPPPPLPLLDPYASTSMPEAWVRGAIVVRINSLIRGHSGIRWELIENMAMLLRADITPLVPLRGSISASGDLSPLSYIAGVLTGNPSVRAFDGPRSSRRIVSSRTALAAHGLRPLVLQAKEHLGILNGTAFSASAAALALHDAAHLALLAQVCTAMGVEALLGTQGSFDSFIHAVARPHPGQVEAAENINSLLEGSHFAQTHEEDLSILEDKGKLRQDRYPLRTAPQFLGPQIEDILSALDTVTRECNSTTDNPMVDGTTGRVHHGGNFQAMAVTSAMEKTRLALHHVGKMLFAQSTELLNPTMNRGLPPSLAASDPSLDYHAKGLDIAAAAYVSELGFLANPVSTHIQSAEMHNQAINSLALISARKTIDAIQVLTMLTASYLYELCQAMDLRALQSEFDSQMRQIVREGITASAMDVRLSRAEADRLFAQVCEAVDNAVQNTTTVDARPRMENVASRGVSAAVDFFTEPATICAVVDSAASDADSGYSDTTSTAGSAASLSLPLSSLQEFRVYVATRGAVLLDRLRREFLTGARGPAPASAYLKHTRPAYEFVRVGLGIHMHGLQNYNGFSNGPEGEAISIGDNISLIYEAIRDGRMQDVVVKMFT